MPRTHAASPCSPLSPSSSARPPARARHRNRSPNRRAPEAHSSPSATRLRRDGDVCAGRLLLSLHLCLPGPARGAARVHPGLPGLREGDHERCVAEPAGDPVGDDDDGDDDRGRQRRRVRRRASTCALPSWLSDCTGAIEDGRAVLSTALGGRLDSLHSSIKGSAPNAAITIGGYPHLFNEISDCSLITYFDRTEMVKLNDATDELDGLISAGSTAAGLRYVDPRAAFDGHAVCDSAPYVNGYSSPIGESYHPNRAGNAAYADLFAPAGGGGGGKGKPRATRTMSIDEQAAYVADLGLDSPESLARAEAVGLEAREIRGLVAQLRSGNETAQLAALKRLEVLDERVSPRRD